MQLAQVKANCTTTETGSYRPNVQHKDSLCNTALMMTIASGHRNNVDMMRGSRAQQRAPLRCISLRAGADKQATTSRSSLLIVAYGSQRDPQNEPDPSPQQMTGLAGTALALGAAVMLAGVPPCEAVPLQELNYQLQQQQHLQRISFFAALTPYQEAQKLVYGPTADGSVRSCPTNINPNCVGTGAFTHC